MERLIYALRCPVTNGIHYIGKSTSGMLRPQQHMTASHSSKVADWVCNLQMFGTAPVISILEEVRDGDDIDARERYWIQYHLNHNAVLLNEMLVTPITIDPNLDIILSGPVDPINKIGRFIKARRKILKMTQPVFAQKCGIALTVLRKIEQGHTNITLDGVLVILSMFGCTLDVTRIVSD